MIIKLLTCLNSSNSSDIKLYNLTSFQILMFEVEIDLSVNSEF